MNTVTYRAFVDELSQIKVAAAAIPGVAKARWFARPFQLLGGKRVGTLQEAAKRSRKTGFAPDINLARAMEAEAKREAGRSAATRIGVYGTPIAGLAGLEATR